MKPRNFPERKQERRRVAQGLPHLPILRDVRTAKTGDRKARQAAWLRRSAESSSS